MQKSEHAFTLIELSIVLVVIGLIVGGILVGRTLIKAAEVRAQIGQMDRLQAAVNTFREKYSELPGDILSTNARNFGIFASTSGPARPWGDGNGVLESGGSACAAVGITNCFYAELMIFWRHLSDAKLIDSTLCPDSLMSSYGSAYSAITTTTLNQFMPAAKIGNGASIAVNSFGGVNYFTLSGFRGTTGIGGYYGNPAAVNPLSAAEAYAIDLKIDDGFVGTGAVIGISMNDDVSNNPVNWVTPTTVPSCSTGTVYAVSNTAANSCSLSFRFR